MNKIIKYLIDEPIWNINLILTIGNIITFYFTGNIQASIGWFMALLWCILIMFQKEEIKKLKNDKNDKNEN